MHLPWTLEGYHVRQEKGTRTLVAALRDEPSTAVDHALREDVLQRYL